MGTGGQGQPLLYVTFVPSRSLIAAPDLFTLQTMGGRSRDSMSTSLPAS